MRKSLKDSIIFPCGVVMQNRFMLAPITNTQSFEDGQLSDDELKWLTMRAKGKFGLVMTCASHVQKVGKGFPGQLGIFSDLHINGHKKLASTIKSYGSLAVIQLHHAGMKSPSELINQAPVCPSANKKYGARELSIKEIYQLRDDFINAGVRAKKCGYNGIEIHGAHGYVIAQFISREFNKRTDEYGGSLANRSRLLFEIITGIRKHCGSNFIIGVRLSPEKYGMDLREVNSLCRNLIDSQSIDFIDISLWDYRKQPEDEKYCDKSLLHHFTSIDRKDVLLTVAGNIRSGNDVMEVLKEGVDFVGIGLSAILQYDFPLRVIENQNFESIKPPVSKDYLKKQGLGKKFIKYMQRWPDFVLNDS